MAAAVAPDEDAIFTELRTFILAQISGYEVVQGLDNRVPEPKAPYILITGLAFTRLRTNIDTYTDPNIAPNDGTQEAEQGVDFMVQIDCVGPDSNRAALILSTLLRDEVGCAGLGPLCQPLYADDPRQIPIVDGEKQYEKRWMILAHLQFNPVVVTPQQFAATLDITLINVDERYKP